MFTSICLILRMLILIVWSLADLPVKFIAIKTSFLQCFVNEIQATISLLTCQENLN